MLTRTKTENILLRRRNKWRKKFQFLTVTLAAGWHSWLGWLTSGRVDISPHPSISGFIIHRFHWMEGRENDEATGKISKHMAWRGRERLMVEIFYMKNSWKKIQKYFVHYKHKCWEREDKKGKEILHFGKCWETQWHQIYCGKKSRIEVKRGKSPSNWLYVTFHLIFSQIVEMLTIKPTISLNHPLSTLTHFSWIPYSPHWVTLSPCVILPNPTAHDSTNNFFVLYFFVFLIYYVIHSPLRCATSYDSRLPIHIVLYRVNNKFIFGISRIYYKTYIILVFIASKWLNYTLTTDSADSTDSTATVRCKWVYVYGGSFLNRNKN